MRTALSLIFTCAVILGCQQQNSSTIRQATSREDELKDLTRKWFVAFNRQDIEYIRNSYADSATLEDPDHPMKPLVGNDKIADTYGQLFNYIPDVYDSIVSLVAEGNRVAVEFRSKGNSPEGPFQMRIFTLFEFNADNKIVRDATYYDPGSH